LTCPADKLPALSGLAKVFRRHLQQDEYLAGLWKGTLQLDLLWYLEGDHLTASQPTASRAPSWSWASIDGPINHFKWAEKYNASIQLLAGVLEAVTHPVDHLDDDTGQVSGGYLRLSGALYQAFINHNIARPNDYPSRITLDNGKIVGEDSLFGLRLVPRANRGGGYQILLDGYKYPDKINLIYLYHSTPVSGWGNHVFLMPLLKVQDFGPDPLILGIVLQPTGEDQPCGTFQKLGIFHMRESIGPWFIEAALAPLDQQFYQGRDANGGLLYVSCRRDERHSFHSSQKKKNSSQAYLCHVFKTLATA